MIRKIIKTTLVSAMKDGEHGAIYKWGTLSSYKKYRVYREGDNLEVEGKSKGMGWLKIFRYFRERQSLFPGVELNDNDFRIILD